MADEGTNVNVEVGNETPKETENADDARKQGSQGEPGGKPDPDEGTDGNPDTPNE